MLCQVNITKMFYNEAIHIAVYILNRSLSLNLENKNPSEYRMIKNLVLTIKSFLHHSILFLISYTTSIKTHRWKQNEVTQLNIDKKYIKIKLARDVILNMNFISDRT